MKTISIVLICVLYFVAGCDERHQRATPAKTQPSKSKPKIAREVRPKTSPSLINDWRTLEIGDFVVERATRRIGMVRRIKTWFVIEADACIVIDFCDGGWGRRYPRHLRWPTCREYKRLRDRGILP